MSAEPEQVSSSSGNLISVSRSSMEDDIVEAIECIKSYERDGITVEIDGTKVDLDDFDAAMMELNASVGMPEVDSAELGNEEIKDQ